MSPLEQIKEALSSNFPDIEIVVRKADDPNGMQFLNVYSDNLEVSVEWKPDRGFGLSSFRSDAHDLDGAYDAPDEWYKSPNAVFHRISSLLIDEQETRAVAMCLGAIRRELGISQEQLCVALEVTQATYSKQERRSDMKVSTLRKAIEAMGGVLRIEARFPDSQDVRELTFQ
ncbi:MAG: helix-turn-helix transcriptional regulator [Planctomycetaceae bacterium]